MGRASARWFKSSRSHEAHGLEHVRHTSLTADSPLLPQEPGATPPSHTYSTGTIIPIQALQVVNTHPKRPNPAYVAGSNGGGPVTVAQLIAALSAIEDQNRTILVKGCDCINPAKGVDTSDPDVLIEAQV